MKKLVVRGLFAAVLLLSILSLAASYHDFTTTSDQTAIVESAEKPYDQREPITDPPTNITVFTAQGTEDTGPKAGLLAAIDETGRLLYQDSRYYSYFDVDPVTSTTHTVSYVAVKKADDECFGPARCRRQIVERVNLSTGDRERIYTRVTLSSKDYGGKWHDVDRAGEHLYAADIGQDQAFRLNLTTRQTTWGWNAQDTFELSAGGPFPHDYTHLNDIEVLQDGRIMVNPRNMDQVLFIEPDRGVQRNWTLGTDGDHETLYEPHNPDYIPPENGGPAILIADSENHRAVEYQRQNGTWSRTWSWQDPQLAWPRDADRLPNDHTLVTDSNGDRILEVAENGSVVWSLGVVSPYEAERLGTGDESTNGHAAATLDIESRDAGETDDRQGSQAGFNDLGVLIKEVVPGPLVNAVLFVRPAWMSFKDVLVTGAMVGAAVVWLLLEMKWYGVRVRSPIRLP
jgi:hypothetical protein